jgi:hypothetical protein
MFHQIEVAHAVKDFAKRTQTALEGHHDITLPASRPIMWTAARLSKVGAQITWSGTHGSQCGQPSD